MGQTPRNTGKALKTKQKLELPPTEGGMEIQYESSPFHCLQKKQT